MRLHSPIRDRINKILLVQPKIRSQIGRHPIYPKNIYKKREFMTFIRCFVIFILTINFVIAKETSSSQKPSQTEDSTIRFEVVYGDKITLFVLSKSTKGSRVDFSNNFGDNSSREVSVENYEFLKSKVNDLPESTQEKRNCIRSYIKIDTNDRTLFGCLESPDKFSKKAREILSLLRFLI